MRSLPVLHAVALLLMAGLALARPAADGELELELVLGGDVMLGRGVDAALAHHDPAWIWGDVGELIRAADLAHVNLECVIAARGAPFQPPRVFYFRASPARAIAALRAAGIDSVTLANNHALDFGAEALLETLAHLERAGIAHAGAGGDRAAAAQPAWLSARDTRVAVLAYADHFPEYAATAAAAGTQLITVSRAPQHFAPIADAIAAARRQGADLVLFSIHWGPNLRTAPPPEFVAFARAVIDAGADIFHGHSAHVFQGIEIYRGRPILYDSGDLIDDYVVDPVVRNDLQLLFRLRYAGRVLQALELLPLKIEWRQVKRARGVDFDAVERLLGERSLPFGTRLRRDGESLRVELRVPRP